MFLNKRRRWTKEWGTSSVRWNPEQQACVIISKNVIHRSFPRDRDNDGDKISEKRCSDNGDCATARQLILSPLKRSDLRGGQVHAWLPFGSADPGLPLSDARSLPGFSDILLVTSHGKQRLIRGSESKGGRRYWQKKGGFLLSLLVPTKTLLLLHFGGTMQDIRFLRSLYCVYLQRWKKLHFPKVQQFAIQAVLSGMFKAVSAVTVPI